MKNTLTTLLLITGLVGTLAVKALANQSRTKELFDFDWRFANGDVAGDEKPEFNDAQWQAVDLPHDVSIYGPFDEKAEGGMPKGFRPLGIGWYRKAFVTPSGLDGKRVWLEFGGVYRAPKVWLNGVLVAERLNGYLGFACDITPYLKSAGQGEPSSAALRRNAPDRHGWGCS